MGLEGKSAIRVCFMSQSSAGSWQIRGKQISEMVNGWEAINKPTMDDIERFDLFCIVKKPDLKFIKRLKNAKKPIVFDIVDSWAQPIDGLKYTDLVLVQSFFRRKFNDIDADYYIFPNQRMKEDLSDVTRNGVAIYHHYKKNIGINPIRKIVKKIGYEGNESFLGEWSDIITSACNDLDIEFVINPDVYTDMDIVVSVRGGEHDCFMSNSYKSNVKIANAMGSGTPILAGHREISCQEVDTGDVLFFTDEESFKRQLNRLCESYDLRKNIHDNFLLESQKFSIEAISNCYQRLFSYVMERRV